LLLAALLLLGSIMLAIVRWLNNRLKSKNKPSVRVFVCWAWLNVIVTTSLLYSATRGYFGIHSVWISIGLLIFEFAPLAISYLIYKCSVGKDADRELDKEILQI